jgi:hypothetical protein
VLGKPGRREVPLISGAMMYIEAKQRWRKPPAQGIVNEDP